MAEESLSLLWLDALCARPRGADTWLVLVHRPAGGTWAASERAAEIRGRGAAATGNCHHQALSLPSSS